MKQLREAIDDRVDAAEDPWLQEEGGPLGDRTYARRAIQYRDRTQQRLDEELAKVEALFMAALILADAIAVEMRYGANGQRPAFDICVYADNAKALLDAVAAFTEE